VANTPVKRDVQVIPVESPSLDSFIRLAFNRWGKVMTGVLSLVLVVAGLYWPVEMARPIFWALSLLSVFLASYGAWHSERNARLKDRLILAESITAANQKVDVLEIKLRERKATEVLLHELSELLNEGYRRRQILVSIAGPIGEDAGKEMDQWIADADAMIMEKLGPSYHARFSSRMGIDLSGVYAYGHCVELRMDVAARCEQLYKFIQEIHLK